MALQIWLPLDGNLNNYGLTDVTLSSGTPTYTTGKIGQCLSTGSLLFNISNNLVTTLGSTNIYSMCCWCKDLNTSTGNRWVFQLGSGTGTCRGLFESNNTASRHWGYNGTGINMSTSINTIDGNWHHICFTSSGSTVKLYVDGIYQSQSTSASTTAMANNTLALTCTDYNINDFRVYDHTLSPREVAEIAKGLVLHYPLNREGFGQDNLLKNSTTNFPELWSGSGDGRTMTTVSNVSVTEWGCNDALRVYGKSGASSSLCLLINNSSHGLTVNQTSVSGQKYTPSIYVKNNHSTNPMYFNFNGLATSIAVAAGECKRVILSATGNGSSYLQYTISASGVSKEYDITFWHPKIELGEIVTPWIPASTDSLYSAMGLNSNIVYDCSGYKHDGTLSGTLSYSSDTPRYSVSTVYNSQGDIAYTSLFSTNTLINEMTISAWIKHSYTGTSYASIFSGLFHLYLFWESANSRYKCRLSWQHATSLSSYSANTSDMGIVCPANTWMHVVWTFKDGYLKAYVNGQYYNYSDRTGTGQYMLSNYYNHTIGSYDYVGNISDVRLYATCLTDQQISELYQTPISLAYNGVLLSAELQE